jgi:hypothetical protein
MAQKIPCGMSISFAGMEALTETQEGNTPVYFLISVHRVWLPRHGPEIIRPVVAGVPHD